MRVLMTGGGTGGHINPAIAIAKTILKNEPDSEIAFVGTPRGMENRLGPEGGLQAVSYRHEGTEAALFHPSNLQARSGMMIILCRKGKKTDKTVPPDVCIGIGGYVLLAGL